MNDTDRRVVLFVKGKTAQPRVERKIIEELGYEVVSADSAEDALEKVAGKRRIDLVLLDADPDGSIDGAEAAKRILAVRNFPVVFMIPENEPGNLDEIGKIAGYGFFRKGSGKITLKSTIETALELFRLREEVREGKDALGGDAGLKKNRDLLNDIGRIAKIGGWKVDVETGGTQWTEELYSIYEADPDYVPSFGKTINFYTPQSRETVSEAVRRFEETGQGYDLEAEIVTVKGNRKWLRVIARPEYLDGKIVSRIGITQDITDRKRAEEELAEKNSLMKTILESSPEVIIFALDKDYRYIAFNHFHRKVIGKIWGKDIEVGTCMLDVMGRKEDRAAAKANFDRALRGEHFMLMEEYGDENLSRLCWLDYYSPLLGLSGEVIGLTCFVLDHTERKKAEDRVVKLLKEKELILKEVHHRIKNNMSTMMSLLSIHATRLKDPEAAAALENAHSLMRSMGVLYDKLYHTENLVDMSVKDYFPTLVYEIIRIHPSTAKVRLTLNVEDFRLGVKELSSLGIMVNELVTNAVKYAFVGREEGLVDFTAAKTGNRVVITVGDDGIGLPETVDLEGTAGFGIVLVKTLVQQLGGTMRIERGEGTRFVIEFKS